MKFLYVIFALLAFVITSCSNDESSAQLDIAERTLSTNPDSALVMLESLPQYRSAQLQARHALLLTEARDKSYIFETDDSLISVACEYYGAHKDKTYTPLAYLYRSIIYLNGRQFAAAIVDAVNAEMYAEWSNDNYLMAKAYEHLADIYSNSYLLGKSIRYRKRAIESYDAANMLTAKRYAQYDLAVAYLNGTRYGKARLVLDSLYQHKNDIDDYLLGSIHSGYVALFARTKEYSKALPHIAALKATHHADLYDIVSPALISQVYAGLNQTDSASFYIAEAERLSVKPSADFALLRAMYMTYAAKGDYKNALNEYIAIDNINTKNTAKALEQSVAIATSDMYKAQLDDEIVHHRHKIILYTIILLISVLIVVFLILHHRLKLRLKSEQIENQVYEIHRLTNEFSEKDNLLDAKQREIAKRQSTVDMLLDSHYGALNRICNEYFDKKDVPQLQQSIIEDFKKEISYIKSPESINDIHKIVNECKDNILMRIKDEIPELKSPELDLLALICVGLSPRTICLVLDIKQSNYYNRKMRLKNKIASSDAPVKDQVLVYLQK